MKRRLRLNAVLGIALVGFFVAAALIGLIWTPFDPLKINILQRMKPPSHLNWLGTDEFGRDVMSRLMAGARNSLTIAVLAVAGAVTAGSIVGLVAGYTRGLVDRLLMMVNDALLAFPGILLALGLLAVMGPNKFGIVLALGLAYMPSVVRIVRGSVLSVRAREFVEASRVMGNSGSLHGVATRAAELHRAAYRARHLDAGLGAAGRRCALLPRPRCAATRGDLGQHAVGGASVHRPGGVARRSSPACASRWPCSA